MILFKSKNKEWHELERQVGYNIGGQWFSLRALRARLFGKQVPNLVSVESEALTLPWWSRVCTLCDIGAARAQKELYYEATVVEEERDVVLLFSTSMGLQFSPTPVRPNH